MKINTKYLAIIVIKLIFCLILFTFCKNKDQKTNNSYALTDEFTYSKFGQKNTYYSIDKNTNICYRLTTFRDADGTVSIIREINTENTDSINETLYYLDRGVLAKQTNEYSIKILERRDLNTYIIPFNPSDSIHNIVFGGDDSFDADCLCELSTKPGGNCTVLAAVRKI